MPFKHSVKSLMIFFVLVNLFSFLIAPAVSHAQLNKLENIGGAAYDVSPARVQTPAQIVGGIINIALGVVGLIFLILMVYGGYLWMTARGKEERLTKAKDAIEAAIIGIIIVIAAYAISYFVVDRIIGASSPPSPASESIPPP